MRAHRASLVVWVALITLAAPAGVFAQAQSPAEEHRRNDQVAPKSLAEERALMRRTQDATAADAQAAAAAVEGSVAEVGSWSAPVEWPVVGVHATLLPNGKVLAYDSIGDQATEAYAVHDHTRATVWDPATGAHTDVRVDTGFNIFCSGLSHMLDGSVFFAGGNKDAHLSGIRQTHIFNHQTNAWSLGADMVYERWYPTVTGLRDGELLITGGGPATPEVRKTDGTLRTLSNAALDLPLYPWLDVAPDGRAFYSGPDQTMRALDPTGTGAWQSFTQRDSINRDYGGHAMFDVGKLLVAGGGNSTSDARVIDINGASPKVSATAAMAFGRRQNNVTMLADGTALATGGNSSGASLVDLDNGVYNAELWDPATGAWKTLAAQRVTRQYHSTALLLPDGRVLSSGGGICGTCDEVGYLAKNAEVFTPPYLYKKDGSNELAPRPQVTAAPATVEYGAPVRIDTPDAAAIRKVGLVRLGAVTHSVDMDQRYVPLAFTAGSGTVTATGPANANVAPPGPYMLFLVDSAGVPSVAQMVTVPPPAAVAEDLALKKPASASSSANKGLTPDKANDGDSSTRWMSAKRDGQWWQVDLGSTRKVDTVELNWSADYAKSYKIQVSTDGVGFTDVASVSISASGLKRSTFSAVDARHVRVLGLTRATKQGISFYDARVFGPTGTSSPPAESVEKATNKPATASSVEAAGYEPYKANDGNSSTRWSSAFADNQWWQVDLGSARKVDSVELNWETAYAKTYKIQTSTDGSTFTDVAAVTLDGAKLERTTFSTVTARYVRVLCLTRGTQWGFSFWDARVFGPPDS